MEKAAVCPLFPGNIFICLPPSINEASEEEEDDEGNSAGATYKIGMEFSVFYPFILA